MAQPFLAVIVPAYDEESRIQKTLERLREYLSAQTYTWTVMVVSDGSRDRTNEIVERFAASNPNFHLNASPVNRGKGFVVRKGMLEAEAEWLLFSDADLAAPIEEIEKLLPALEKAPIAIGSRPMKESQLEIRQPFYREMLGRAANKLIQMLAVKGIQDTQCGFKIFRQDVARDVFSRCKRDGFSFDFEALMIAHELGYAIEEIPIRWSHQEGSKVVLWRDVPKTFRDLIKLRLMGKSNRLKQRES